MLNLLDYSLKRVGFCVYIDRRVFAKGTGMRRPPTLRQKIEQRIARKKGEDVFLTREFRTLGGEDQVVRALRELVEDGRLVRLGYGVYGRAVVSRLNGKPMLYSRDGFAGGGRQGPGKLGGGGGAAGARRGHQEGGSPPGG